MNKLFKLLAVLAFAFGMSSTAMAVSLKVDQAHSAVRFEITHLMISKVDGRFAEFSGKVYNAENGNLRNAKIDFTVDVASIDTANNDRDNHLRSDDFFNVEKHPKASFKSKRVRSSGIDRYRLIGDLTIHGVTKEVTFDVTYLGTNVDPWGNTKHGYEARTTLNRRDFGLTWNQALDTGGVLIGNQVELRLTIQANEVEKE